MGGAGNDTLEGGSGADTFICDAGKDVITDFGDEDLLQITGEWTAAYNAATNTIAFTTDSGTVTLKEVASDGTFNVNGEGYIISDSELVKK